MKHTLYNICLGLWACIVFSACELLSPSEVENPNVVESDFANSPDAMNTWVNGTNARFAVALAKFSEFTGLLSDDLYNNSSRSSKGYDVLDIRYTDGEVTNLSTHIGRLLQMSDYGLQTLAQKDEKTTSDQLFNLHYIRIYACLLGAENFVALPTEARGEVLDRNAMAKCALAEVDAAQASASNNEQKALLALLQARAYRLLGDLEHAVSSAQKSLSLAGQMVYQVQFDGLNGFANSLQELIASDLFTILPRLQEQKAKFPMDAYWNQPIAFAKSEEAWLIQAEAYIAGNDYVAARSAFASLLDLIGTRNATISATSVLPSDIEAAQSKVQMLELLYLLRQEVFFGEGRRSSDLGIRLPLSEVEYNDHNNLPTEYTQPVIPAFLLEIRNEIDKHEDINHLLVANL